MNSKSDTIDAEKQLADILAQATTIQPPKVNGLWSDYVQEVCKYGSFKDLLSQTQALLLRERHQELKYLYENASYGEDKRVGEILDRIELRMKSIEAELSRLSGEESHE